MARKSRKEIAQVVVQEPVSTCRAALYVRLSVEDSHTHSASIETQQMIIAQFLERNPDIQVYDTYIDNGTSGTTFHRPAFQKMLSDIESGFVNCVIVKDLSRLGRNTIDTGYYIEQYFRLRNTRTVAKILHAQVYTGDLVQGRTKIVDHQQVEVSEMEWTVVHDTHEAIVSHELFEAVQKKLDETAKHCKEREVQAYSPNILKGKIFCAHCGGSLHRHRNFRKKSADVYLFYCLTNSRIAKERCPGVLIRENDLLDSLTDMLQNALDAALGSYSLSLMELPQHTAERTELNEKITIRKQEIHRLRGLIRSLYENLIQDILTKEEYITYKGKYESKIEQLSEEVSHLEKGLKALDKQMEQHRALKRDSDSLRENRELTAALIDRLIDRVEVSKDKQITVRYRFESEFDSCEEMLNQCKNM